MNVHEELIQRCAARRRKALGDLSDQGFAELLLAVRENPSAFVDSPAEEAYVELERAFSAYDASLNNDDLLEDDEYQKARQKRLANLQAGCARALALDEKCLDAQLVGTLAADLDPDSLLEQLLGLHDGTDAASNAPEGCDPQSSETSLSRRMTCSLARDSSLGIAQNSSPCSRAMPVRKVEGSPSLLAASASWF